MSERERVSMRLRNCEPNGSCVDKKKEYARERRRFRRWIGCGVRGESDASGMVSRWELSWNLTFRHFLSLTDSGVGHGSHEVHEGVRGEGEGEAITPL